MARRYTRDNRGRFSSTGATARGGRLRTAAGNKRATQTTKLSGGKASGTVAKPKGLKPGAIKAKPQVSTTRKEQLAAGAQRRNAQADRIDAKVKALEGQYRSKDAAFYTQGAKPAGRDRMIAKSQQAAQLREQSAALRTKAANAEKMSQQTKGTAASKKQERRNDFDAAGYKVGDTVTTKQYGTQKITKISKNSVSFDTGNAQDKAFMANYLQLQARPANPVSTARQGATDRLKVKTQTRRAIRADRSSVVTPGQRSRLETGKGSTMAGARPASTVAKPRTAGNTKPQVASRVERKLAATNANLSGMTRYGRTANPTTYSRQLKRSVTLQRAQSYLTTGKLPGRDNSIAFKRSIAQSTKQINAKRAARNRAAASQQSSTQGRQARAAANFTRSAAAKPLPGTRRLTKPQVRSQLRTESAVKIYKGGEAGAKEIRNARGLARTSKARNNQLQTRTQRLENAQRSGNPLVTVSGFTKRRRKLR
jgi:hypothetical protein